jgi:hypothetical protein
MKAIFDESGAAYNPKRDGPLDRYLEVTMAINVFRSLEVINNSKCCGMKVGLSQRLALSDLCGI